MVEINECVLPFGTVSQSQPSATRQAVRAPIKVVQYLPFRPCFGTRICAANPAQARDQIHKAEIVCTFDARLPARWEPGDLRARHTLRHEKYSEHFTSILLLTQIARKHDRLAARLPDATNALRGSE
jgi:hypothetical protein